MNVLFVSGIGGDSRRYRCVHHQEQLALCAMDSTIREPDDMQLYIDATSHDLVILQRTPLTPLLNDVIDIAHSRNVPVLFETDDLVFRPELYAQIGLLDTLSTAEARHFRTSLQEQRAAFQRCDAALVTTEFLAEMVREEDKPAYVHRNAISRAMIEAAESAYRLRQTGAQPDPDNDAAVEQLATSIVIGYMSGTGSHNRDFALVTPTLSKLMQEFPHLTLHLSGHLNIDPSFEQFGTRIRRAPYVSWRELPHLIAQLDINLAPLELDNPFCQAKSEIKYTEAALVGVPTVASPVDAYRYAIEDGSTGYLASNPQEWHSALRRLIVDSEVRKTIGTRARQHVYEEYLPEIASQRLRELLQQIMDDFQAKVRRQTNTGTTQETATLVAQRMKVYLEQAQERATQLSQQLDDLRQTLEQWEDSQQQVYWRRQWESAQSKHTDELRTILARLQQSRQT